MAAPNPKATSGATGATPPKPTKATTPTQVATSGQKSNENNSTKAPTGPEVSALQDTGYLNTSKPKDFPTGYRPLSEVSRFVFDSADTSDTFKIDNSTGLPIIDLTTGQTKGIENNNSNRKYFGANVAVREKLEKMEFSAGGTNSFDRQDYIAYLIPYGTPAIASTPTQTISTTVNKPGQLNPAQLTAAPDSDAIKLKKIAPNGYGLFIGSTFITSWLQLKPSDIDTEAKKKAKAEQLKRDAENTWIITINSLRDNNSELNTSQEIIDSIKSIYLDPIYPTIYQPLLRTYGLFATSTPSFEIQKFIQDLAKVVPSRSLEVITVPPPTENANVLPPPPPALNPQQATEILKGACADPVCKKTLGDAGTTGIDPSLKIWQFLYNPQSITIDVRADYAESNTWGATDDGQSGQSLIWQRNRNPEMRLDEVILNGYIQGVKVGQLEEGLFALLMSRDGPGQIEPTVWEFVWGKRRFGPCVINDIQVVEKQWEAGEVLSAVVSFKLTQIPKWQIIDKTVKFYDPTAMGTFAEPTPAPGDIKTPSGETPPGTTPTDKTNKPGGGGKDDPCKKSFYNIVENGNTFPITKNNLLECNKKAKIDLYNKVKGEQSVKQVIDVLVNSCSKYQNPSLGNNAVIKNLDEQNKFKTEARLILLEGLKNAKQCVENASNRLTNPTSINFNAILSNIQAVSNSDPTGNTAEKDRAVKDQYIRLYSLVSSAIFSGNESLLASKLREIILKTSNKSGEKLDKDFCRKDSFNKIQENGSPYRKSKCLTFIWGAIMLEANQKKIEVNYSQLNSNSYNTGPFIIKIIEYQGNTKIPKKLSIKYPGFLSKDTEIDL